MDFGTFELKTTTAGDAVTLEGIWKFTGGTGTFAGIRGNGIDKGIMISSTEVETKWEGFYEID